MIVVSIWSDSGWIGIDQTPSLADVEAEFDRADWPDEPDGPEDCG